MTIVAPGPTPILSPTALAVAPHTLREAWLQAAVGALRPLFLAKKHTIPACQVSCGFASKKATSRNELSPNAANAATRYPWVWARVICSADYTDAQALKYGVDSNVYRVRVLGEFPKQDDDTVISLAQVEDASARAIEPEGKVVWGLDVARFGNDRTALCRRRGNVVTHKVLTFAEVGRGRQKVRRTRQAFWRVT